MTREDFQAQMERMSFLFDRPSMRADAMEAWYPNFVTVDTGVLAHTLDYLVTSFEPTRGERYPSLTTILKTLPKPKEDAPKSCIHCAAGTILFELYDEGMGKVYGIVAACDCAAGNRRATVNYPKGKMHRYSSVFPMDSAQYGFGMSPSKPPTKDDADGAGFRDPDPDGRLRAEYERRRVV